jgi:hypothetical protein
MGSYVLAVTSKTKTTMTKEEEEEKEEEEVVLEEGVSTTTPPTPPAVGAAEEEEEERTITITTITTTANYHTLWTIFPWRWCREKNCALRCGSWGVGDRGQHRRWNVIVGVR